MARASLGEVAKKIAESIKSGTIKPGEQYTLHAFAKLVGCYQSAVQKVLEMWSVLDDTACQVSIDKLTTDGGKRPHYAIRVMSTHPSLPPSVNVTYTLSSKNHQP